MSLSTFPEKKDPRFTYKNRFGIPDEIFTAIVRQCAIQIEAAGSASAGLKVINDADYTILPTDTHILYRALSTARALTLPNPATSQNRVLYLAHGGDGAFVINLNYSVKQSTSTSINSLGTAATYIAIASDGTDWWIVEA